MKHRTDLQSHTNLIVLELSVARKKVFFVLVYRKFGQTPSEFETFTQKLDELFTNIEKENPYMMFTCGDFNAHSATWWRGDKSDNFGTTIQQLFDDHLLTQTVHQPTFLTNNCRTCIDLVATDQPNLILSNEVHPSLHTTCHHQVNFVKVNLKCPPPPPYERRLWHYGRANYEAIQTSLTEFDWDTPMSNFDQDIDSQVNLLSETVLNVAENFIPFEDRKVKPRDPPWLTKNLKNFYTKYRKKYNKFVRNGCKVNEKSQIDNLRSEYTTLVQNEKDRYFKSLGSTISNPNSGPKKYWSAMKKILKKNITSVIPPILSNVTYITNIYDKCTLFNEYFKNQCKTIITSSVLPREIIPTTNTVLNNVEITEEQILVHIRKLNINKAHGHDKIPIRIIKICDKSLAKPLLIIYKNCVKKGYFPKEWKKANVVPIHKKNEKNSINNYRPISLLPVFGKLLERVIFDSLYSYIFKNKLITDKQSGYRYKDSTVKQLLSITHDIFKAFDSGHEVRAVFLDISRAFDRVWHDGLIYKLKMKGIGGDMINILTSFLSDREQRVTIDGQFSEWTSIDAGVPQGSILGPILFLVYINDLVDVVNSNIKIFADDTFIYRIMCQFSTELLTNDLNNIKEWAHMWKMSFNPDLSKQAVEIVFSHKSHPTVCETLYFSDIPVKKVDDTQHIGMILDSRLNFQKHLEKKLAKSNKGLGMMKQVKKWISNSALEQIYKSYVRTHLDYGDVVYHTAVLDKTNIFSPLTSNSTSKKIEKIQTDAARIVTGA